MPEPEIVTVGGGWVERPGDRAELDVGLADVAATREAAVAALGERVAALDLTGATVRHRRFWVGDEWRDNAVVGCRAGEDIGLLVTDLAQLERVLAAVLAAEPATLQGPRWVLADPGAARREAQQRAVDDARDRAEGYAAALGGRLGPLRRLAESEAMAWHEQGHAMDASLSRGVTDVRNLGLEPEPVRVTVQCTTTWTLLA